MSNGSPSNRPTRQGRLTTQLLIAFLLLALIPALVLTIVPALIRVEDQRQQGIDALVQETEIRQRLLEDWNASNQARLREILNDGQIRPLLTDIAATKSRDAVDEFVERTTLIVQSGGIFERIVLIAPGGEVLASSDPEYARENETIAGEDWFNQALQDPTNIVLDGPKQDLLDQKIDYEYAIAFRDSAEGNPNGVLLGEVSTDRLAELMRTVSSHGDATEYYLVRDGRQYVLAPGEDLALVSNDEITPALLTGVSGQGEWKDYRGTSVTGIYRWLGDLNLGLVVKQDTSALTGNFLEIIQLQLILGAVIIILVAVSAVIIARRVTAPVVRLSEVASRISMGDTTLRAPIADTEEYAQLGEAFNRMTSKLTQMVGQQDEMIRSRTRQLELTAQIGRVVAAETDPERLLRLTINMIREQLGFYHVQIFMLDDLHQYAVLRASTGAVGQQLITRGHKLAVGSQSVIGQVTSRGDPMVVSDTGQNPIHARNELLPDTRAELAVPLRIGDEIIGALDVQSVQADVFDEATIASFRTIADQLAVAIRNAQLFEEKEGLLSASLQLTQTLTRENWESYLSQRKGGDIRGFSYDLSGVRALDEGEGENGGGVALPIALRGEIIGEMIADLPEGANLSEEQQQLVGQVLDRVALALENARLFEQTQVSLAEANRLYQASQQIAAADSVTNLVSTLMAMIQHENVDRAAVILLSEEESTEHDRWIEIPARWLRDDIDPSTVFPERSSLSQFKLLTNIEKDIPEDGLIINDVQKYGFDSETTAAIEQARIKSIAYFPLITGGRTLGWLLLNSTHNTNVFSQSDNRFYGAIADQASTALEGLRLFEQAQVRLRRVQATNEVSKAASSILNPDILLPLTVDKISEAFGYYHTQIFLVDEVGEWAVLRASTGEVGQELLRRGHRLAVASQSVIGQVTTRGEPVIARDTDADHVHKRNELLPDTRAEMAIPLKTGDRVIGALDVQSTLVNAFDAEAQVILQSLADQISVTLENAQLFQEIQDRVAELTTVNLISQAVSRAETLQDLYDVVATQLQRTFGVQHALLAVVTPDQMIEVPIFLEAGQLQPPVQPIPVGQGLTSHVIRTREVLLINENLEDEAAKLGARVIGVMPRSLLAVPLLLGDEIIGVISIQDAEREHAYNETHVRQLTTLAAYIAIKIRNAELLNEAQQRASELGFLFNVTGAAVAAATVDDALSNVATILRDEIQGTEAALIYLKNQDGDALEPHAAVGYGRELAARQTSIPMDQGFIRTVAIEGKPLIMQDFQEQHVEGGFVDDRSRAGVVVPLTSGSEIIGVLMIMSTQPGVFKEREERLLETASGTLTAIIQNARLLDQITKANDQLRELDKLKSQFLANMSHELRTPLNSIIGFSRVMLKGIDGPLSDLQTQDLNTIYNSGQHLLGLINDILDLSKIEAGKMEIQPEYIGLGEIIDGVMATGKGLLKDKPIQLFKEADADLPQVYGDPVRIRQVLLNLVSNASKFTNEGSITIQAVHKPADASSGEPDRVQIDVRDTGIGIAGRDMDKLFEAFRQVDGSTTRQVGGTGLGLAISKQFVEMHFGRMWVNSEVGVGSVFSFTIPIQPPALEPTLQVFHSGTDGGSRPLVVAVDDEIGVLELYGRYLDKGGYEMVGLNNANDLLYHLRELNPSALLLDLNLPGKDGWQALQDLSQSDDKKNLPVIVCSIEDQRERAAKAGVSAYLIKPIVEDDLLKAIENAISSAPARVTRVLVADANTERLEVIRATLAGTGYEVNAVSNGIDALQLIMGGVAEVVILDLELPDMDGYGLLTSIRSQPGTVPVPVLLVGERVLNSEDLTRVNASLTRVLNTGDFTPERLLSSLNDLLNNLQAPA